MSQPKQPATKSATYRERADAHLRPLMPARVQFLRPPMLERGSGAFVWDVEGDRFLDLQMDEGAALLGHHHPRVDQAVKYQIESGALPCPEHPLAIELAERLCDLIPGAESVALAHDASAILALARDLARAFTGRRIILSFADSSSRMPVSSRSRRASERDEIILPPGNLDVLQRCMNAEPDAVAALMIDPFAPAAEAEGFLDAVREMAGRRGALLILDETRLGLRPAIGGAQAFLAVRADMTCLGRGLANGHPLAALTVRREIMGSLTRESEGWSPPHPVSLAAALATLRELKTPGEIPRLASLGETLRQGFQQAAAEHGLDGSIVCPGPAFGWRLKFRDSGTLPSRTVRNLFAIETLRRGLLFGPVVALSLAHDGSSVRNAQAACDEALAAVRARIGRAEPARAGSARGAPARA